MAPLALRVHLNHFNAIIIMRLSNIIFKGFCEEGKELHFLCLTILGRGREQVNGCGGDNAEEEGRRRVTCNPAHTPRTRRSAEPHPLGLTAQCSRASQFTATESQIKARRLKASLPVAFVAWPCRPQGLDWPMARRPRWRQHRSRD